MTHLLISPQIECENVWGRHSPAQKGEGNGDVGRGRQTHRKIWIPDEEPEPPTGHEPAAFQVILVDPTIRLFIEG
jgi:hypothetical protein